MLQSRLVLLHMNTQSPDQIIENLSKSYNVNTKKPNFPVNTMRLYYLLTVSGLTKNDSEITARVNKVIPKISALLDARDLALNSKKDKNTPLSEFTACKKAVEGLLKEVDTPQLRQTIQVLFTDIYPVQEALLNSIDQYLKSETLTVGELVATLKIRAMDSVLYAGVIDQIIAEESSHEGNAEVELNSLYTQINVTLQINDLVDAIVYAKQDLAAKSATIIEIIKKISDHPDKIEETISTTFTQLTNLSKSAPIEGQTQEYISYFNSKLIQAVFGEKEIIQKETSPTKDT